MTNGSNTLKRGSETIVTASTKTSSKKQKTKSQQVKTRATAKVQLSSKSYRTPNQVMKADHERNKKLAQLQKAYEWAVSQKENYENRVELAKEASCRFNVTVVPQTLRKLIREGRSQILLSGPKCKMPKDHMDTISSALNTWLAIGQINGDPERKTDDILRVLDQVLKYKKL